MKTARYDGDLSKRNKIILFKNGHQAYDTTNQEMILVKMCDGDLLVYDAEKGYLLGGYARGAWDSFIITSV